MMKNEKHFEKMRELRETNVSQIDLKRVKMQSTILLVGLVLLFLLTLVEGGRLWIDYAGRSVVENSGRVTSDDGSGYWAVMLSSGQEYYGKIVFENGDIIILEDVYYLEVGRRFQNDSDVGNIKLIKHGSEVHGPADRIELNRDHVMQVEELSKDSKIVKAIGEE